MMAAFVHEFEAYALLTQAGLPPPRHGRVGDALPFNSGEPVVVKGIARDLWHKTEAGAVHFLGFDAARVADLATTLRPRLAAAGHEWIGALVCERLAFARPEGLPSQALVSLTRGDAGWTLVLGCGGLAADALGRLAPPHCWPLGLVTPDTALDEFSRHLLGRVWLGRLRGTRPLTTRAQLAAFFTNLWRLAPLAEAEGIQFLELNPVVLDLNGQPRPLDAVGCRAPLPPPRLGPPPGFIERLRHPRRIALAGVSAQPGGVGRTILENLERAHLAPGDLRLVRPGASEFLGHPAVPDVAALLTAPVDLLILALPAAVAAAQLQALITQGGGASLVALVAGGLGDGADATGLGERLARLLREARAAGRWTPTVLGPNFLGHWVPASELDTSFIPVGKLAAPDPAGGPLTLLSQSGAFLLSRRSRQPHLRFGLGIALGNQLDAAWCDVLAALAAEPQPGPVACYLEGIGPGQLPVAVRAIRQLREAGAAVVVHRAGCTAAGQAAAASHTGAVAGDLVLEGAWLGRAGARLTTSIAEFDAVLTWLGAYPQLLPGPVAIITNAGFESVNGSDRLAPPLAPATLSAPHLEELAHLLDRHQLNALVAPRLPLDLTPMADTTAFLAACELISRTAASVLLVGLVPFTRRLETAGTGAETFTRELAGLSRTSGKAIAGVVDAGSDYEAFRRAFTQQGLPVFSRMEDALLGLRVLAAPGRDDVSANRL